MPETLSCTLNRSWVFKMSIFVVVLVGFGVWALFDAAILYPARGMGYASVKLRDFLAAADTAGMLRADKIAVADPKAELSRLEGKLSELALAARNEGRGSEAKIAAMEIARHDWLSALALAWSLNAGDKALGEFTVTPADKNSPAARVQHALYFRPGAGTGYDRVWGGPGGAGVVELDPQKLRDELVRFWTSTPQPTPLSGWDLPLQWSFVLVGFGVGAFLLYLLIKCRGISRRIRFEPEGQRLTLSNGASMVPADLRDVDKRLWHKFYVTLITLDGSEHKLDLLRYVPLEDWVLAMERTRFPERAAEDDARGDDEDGGAKAVGEETVEAGKGEEEKVGE